MLNVTVADQPWIDALRGFVAVASILLLLAAPATALLLRHHLPRRVVSLLIVLIGADIYIGGTEAQQIGHPMLVWRLPLGFAVIVGALVYIARTAAAASNGDPLK